MSANRNASLHFMHLNSSFFVWRELSIGNTLYIRLKYANNNQITHSAVVHMYNNESEFSNEMTLLNVNA